MLRVVLCHSLPFQIGMPEICLLSLLPTLPLKGELQESMDGVGTQSLLTAAKLLSSRPARFKGHPQQGLSKPGS